MIPPLESVSEEEGRLFNELFERHRGQSQVPLIQHRRSRISELERALANRKPIYLDTKYWVYLRDPDESPDPEAIRELKASLYAGVASGKLFCPLSFALYDELMVIMPLERRLATARIMDDLSLGYSFSGPEDLYGLEITRFFLENSQTMRRFTYAVQPIWTRIGLLFGEAHPPRGVVPADYELALDKALLDRMWNLTITEMADKMPEHRQREHVADQINEERRQFPRAGRSFKQLYADELHGLLDFNKHIIDSSLRDVARLVLPPSDIPESAFSAELPANVPVKLIRDMTTLGRGQPGIAMQRTEAALYASLRLDEGRPFRPNDASDIRHTAAALAYCDLYLTERSFEEMARRRDIRSVAPVQCQVSWIPAEALSLLRAITG